VTQLSELPPPRKGARAGYYPDPLGSRHARWWDGQAWTFRVGPLTPPDAPRNRALERRRSSARSAGSNRRPSRAPAPTAAAATALPLVANESDEHSINSREYAQVAPRTAHEAVESDFDEPYAEEGVRRRECLY
jgi:Protein of unknown function (DUF2510)